MHKRSNKNDNISDWREESIRKIRHAIENGSSFDQACSLISAEHKELKEAIVSESLKSIIADQHVFKGMPLKQLAMKLKLSMSRLIKAKEGMESDREEARLMKDRTGITGRQDLS